MAPRKLSDADKSEIVDLYRQPGQTTSTLAEQFGVSNSTVSRILKMSLPSEEYSELIAQKRMSGSSDKGGTTRKRAGRKQTKKTKADATAVKKQEAAEKPQAPKLKEKEVSDEAQADEAGTTRRRRRRRKTKEEESEQLPLLTAEDEETAEKETESDQPTKPVPAPKKKSAPVVASQEEEDDEDDEDDLTGLDETLGDDFGDDDDIDEELEDDDEDDSGLEVPKPKLKSERSVAIMPLDEAILPKPCYLVVDMRAELITRPLSDFAELGQIPSAEEKATTLPVFDNHRVARRFSRNKQRVIKVPDGSLITRTSPYLQAKGITRLLVDGQVFDLGNR